MGERKNYQPQTSNISTTSNVQHMHSIFVLQEIYKHSIKLFNCPPLHLHPGYAQPAQPAEVAGDVRGGGCAEVGEIEAETRLPAKMRCN